jgi:hypothetical protein
MTCTSTPVCAPFLGHHDGGIIWFLRVQSHDRCTHRANVENFLLDPDVACGIYCDDDAAGFLFLCVRCARPAHGQAQP